MTAEIRFYHLERQALEEVLPALLGKALARGHRIILRCPDDDRAEDLSARLWSYEPSSFLPHGTAADGRAAEQPVFLTARDENPNGADLLVTVDGVTSPLAETLPLTCDLFDGRDPAAVQAARGRWKRLRDAGHRLTYWQQGPRGGWEQKA